MLKSKWLLAIMTLCLSACSHSYLTFKEQLELNQLRNMLPVLKDDQDRLTFDLIHEDTERLVKENVKKGDYSLISFAGGYHATIEDAEIFGIQCTTHVETKPFVTGCGLAPDVFFKIMYHYNLLLLQQPEFPAKGSCEVDPKVKDAIEKM